MFYCDLPADFSFHSNCIIIMLPSIMKRLSDVSVMKKRLRLIILFAVLLLAVFIAAGIQAQAPSVYVLTIQGTINPVLVDYVERGIEEAEDNNARALIIQLDTPGGLDTAMRDIVKLIVNCSCAGGCLCLPVGFPRRFRRSLHHYGRPCCRHGA